jgi:hypothetical protein
MLHQFFSAETVQVPEECVLFLVLGVLFLSHHWKLPDSQSYVNANFNFAASATQTNHDKQY